MDRIALMIRLLITPSTMPLEADSHRLAPLLVARPLMGSVGIAAATFIALWFMFVPAVSAQIVVQQARTDAPYLARLAPPILVAGEPTEVTLHGERLNGPTAVLSMSEHRYVDSHGKPRWLADSTAESASQGIANGVEASSPRIIAIDEVSSTEDDHVTLKLTAAADLQPGPYFVHFLCEAGLSNPKVVWIAPAQSSRSDEATIAAERESNDELSQANEMPAPGYAWGTLRNLEFDCFRFHLDELELQENPHRPFMIDVIAGRLGSPIRPVVTLYDSTGRELASGQVASPGIEPDMRLVYEFTAAGDYTIKVSDRVYRGDANASYVIHVAPAGFAGAMYPPGGARLNASGSATATNQATIELSGEGLETPWRGQLDLAALGQTEPTHSSSPIATSRFAFAAESGEMLIAPAIFAMGEYPEGNEREPNNASQDATPLEIPRTYNGRIDQPGDVDRYLFSATAGERIRFELLAAAIGSPMDGVLTVRNLEGRIVATADDRPADDDNPPVVRSAIVARSRDDPLLEFSAPAAGEYVLGVEDRYALGSPRHVYRLTAGPPRESVALYVQPAPARGGEAQAGVEVHQNFFGQSGAGALTLDRGGRGALVVQAIRRGYNGPINLQVDGLPPGVTAASAQVPAGRNDGVIILEADFDASPSAGFVRVTGQVRIGDEEQSINALQPVYLSALAGGEVARRVLTTVAVGVSNRGAELALLADAKLQIAPGGRGELLLRVHRRAGLSGDVVVSPANLRDGIEIPQITIPAGEDEMRVAVQVSADVSPGNRQVTFRAIMQPSDGEPSENEQPFEATGTTLLEIRPLVAVELLTRQADLPVGKTTVIKLRVERAADHDIPLRLQVQGLPADVTVAEESLSIAGSTSGEISLPLTVSADATASSLRRFIRIRIQGEHDDDLIDLPTVRCAVRLVDE